MAAFGLTVGAALAASGFVDVADNHRASAEITAAHQVGVFQGYGDGTFRPDLKLTRGQAELVIRRMLTWQGTDDDGNFEISRADAAVLAMSGLCGLDPDRIPACAAVAAAVSEAEVQAAYDRGYDNGFDDGLDAATPTGSTPPPVTAPAAPTTSAQKCEADEHNFMHFLKGGGWNGRWISGPRPYRWSQGYVADFPNGFVCTVYTLYVGHALGDPARNWVQPVIRSFCWETGIDPISGQEYVAGTYRHYMHPDSPEHPKYRRLGDAATPAILAAIAGDRPDPEYWPAHDPADCLTNRWPGFDTWAPA